MANIFDVEYRLGNCSDGGVKGRIGEIRVGIAAAWNEDRDAFFVDGELGLGGDAWKNFWGVLDANAHVEGMCCIGHLEEVIYRIVGTEVKAVVIRVSIYFMSVRQY
jgi:hypothetical protein